MGRKADDLPEIELVDEDDGDVTSAEVVVASGPRPEMVWLVVGIAVLGVGAVASSVWDSDESEEPWPTSATVDKHADAAGGLAANDRPVSAGTVATYDLTMPGATLKEDTTSEPRGLPVTVWANADTLLSLAVRPGDPGTGHGPMPGPGPCRSDTAVDGLPESQGTIWLTVPPNEPTALLCWNRSSGDFWMLRAHWSHDTPPVADRAESLRLWALGIRTDGPSGTAYRLQDQQMRRIDSDPGGTLRARARVWDYDDHEILLFVIENSSATSLANLVETGHFFALVRRGDDSTDRGGDRLRVNHSVEVSRREPLDRPPHRRGIRSLVLVPCAELDVSARPFHPSADSVDLFAEVREWDPWHLVAEVVA